MTIFRSDQAKQLQDGLNAVVGLENMSIQPAWRDIFVEEGSDKAYEEQVMMAGTGAASVKAEGAGVGFDDMYETYTARYTHSTVAMAVSITEEAVEDNLYLSMGSEIARSMNKSMNYTKEVRRANILNYMQSASYLGGDGVALGSLVHPLGGGGTIQNILTTPAQLSESSMEEMKIIISKWTDERGIPGDWSIKKLVVPPELEFVAERLTASSYQPDTESNNINAFKSRGILKNGYSLNRYLTDPTKWFFITDCRNGLKAFIRRPLKKGLEGEFESGNLRYKLSERYSEGWTNPRGVASSG